MKKTFNAKIKIEEELTSENLWTLHYSAWKELWASASIKEISSAGAVYLFQIKWRGKFLKNFRIIFQNDVLIPIQPVLFDRANDDIFIRAKTV